MAILLRQILLHLISLIMFCYVVWFSEVMGKVDVVYSPVRVLNVNRYGAKGDGTDATLAFKMTWMEACSSDVPVVFTVPWQGTYLLNPIVFSGPCKSTVIMKIKGSIVASSRSNWDGTDHMHWILFKAVDNLHINGGGTINGNGQTWWTNSCKINKSLVCTAAPTALTFYLCNNLNLNKLNIKDSQQIHVSIEQCSNVKISRLIITAPERSPNTDGIHVAGTKNISIKRCMIRTGDDCISIVDGSMIVKVTELSCGPGHGISIGSLGALNAYEHVSNVVVDNAELEGTTNGVRIKTWQGGRGYVENIIFRNINMHNVGNPIIIDQNYCDSKNPCKQQIEAVSVSNVVYKNIQGTSATPVAVKFDCSESVPCRGIVLQNIHLTGGNSFCRNAVSVKKSGSIVPATSC